MFLFILRQKIQFFIVFFSIFYLLFLFVLSAAPQVVPVIVNNYLIFQVKLKV